MLFRPTQKATRLNNGVIFVPTRSNVTFSGRSAAVREKKRQKIEYGWASILPRLKNIEIVWMYGTRSVQTHSTAERGNKSKKATLVPLFTFLRP